MQISEETVKRFQRIFEEDYGRKLTKKEAFEAANNLLGFFDLLLKVDRRINSNLYEENITKNDSKRISK